MGAEEGEAMSCWQTGPQSERMALPGGDYHTNWQNDDHEAHVDSGTAAVLVRPGACWTMRDDDVVKAPKETKKSNDTPHHHGIAGFDRAVVVAAVADTVAAAAAAAAA